MYVLIVAQGYPTEQYGGNGIFEFDQARALAAAGCKVVFAAIDLRSIRRKRPLGRRSFAKDGVRIEAIDLPCGAVPRNFFLAIGTKALTSVFRSIVDRYGMPDVIHAHSTDYICMAAHVAKRYGVPYVVTEHSSLLNKDSVDRSLLQSVLEPYASAKARIAVSNAFAARLVNMTGLSFQVIPNVVDTSEFSSNLGSRSSSRDIVTAGGLSPVKNIDILIDSFDRAFPKEDNKMLIFGKGPEESGLRELVTELGLDNRVQFMGYRSRSELARVLPSCAFYVCASQHETFGVACAEALAAGLPVVTTRCGGPEDFIDDECGILVTPGDVEELALALKMMMSKKDSFDPSELALRARRFSPEVVAGRLMELYADVLESQEGEAR
ncbi:MAG: glycosyltransferase family 4 protein [Actinobacteria bacterium]|nr:glycosyltransferase family 4 protein [Actinomycetota bacterium]